MTKKNGTVKRKHTSTKSIRRLKKIIKKIPHTRSKKQIKIRTIKRGGAASEKKKIEQRELIKQWVNGNITNNQFYKQLPQSKTNSKEDGTSKEPKARDNKLYEAFLNKKINTNALLNLLMNENKTISEEMNSPSKVDTISEKGEQNTNSMNGNSINGNSMNGNEYSNMSGWHKWLLFVYDPNKFEKLEVQEMKNREEENTKKLWEPVLSNNPHSKRESEGEYNIEAIKTSINTLNKQRIFVVTSPEIEDKTDELASLTKAINEQLKILEKYKFDNEMIDKLRGNLQKEMDYYLKHVENFIPPQFLIVLLTKYVNLKKHDQLQLTQDERKKVDQYEREYPVHYNAALTTVLEHQKDFNLVDHENLHENTSAFKVLLLKMGNIDEFLFKIKLQSLLNIYTPNNYYENLKKEYFKFRQVWLTSNSLNTQKNKKEKEFQKQLANIIYNAGLKYFKQIYIDDDINGATNFATGKVSKPPVLNYYKSKELMFFIISELENRKQTHVSIRDIHNKMDELRFLGVTTDDVVLKQILFGEIEQILFENFESNWIKQGMSKKVINAKNIYALVEDFTKNPMKHISQQKLAQTIINGRWRNITEKQFEMIKQTLTNRLEIANTTFNSHLNTNQLTKIERPKNKNRAVKPKGESGKNITNNERVNQKILADSVIQYRKWLSKGGIKSASATNNEVIDHVKYLIEKYPGEDIEFAAATEQSLRENKN